MYCAYCLLLYTSTLSTRTKKNTWYSIPRVYSELKYTGSICAAGTAPTRGRLSTRWLQPGGHAAIYQVYPRTRLRFVYMATTICRHEPVGENGKITGRTSDTPRKYCYNVHMIHTIPGDSLLINSVVPFRPGPFSQ